VTETELCVPIIYGHEKHYLGRRESSFVVVVVVIIIIILKIIVSQHSS
jgi:uncharacterized membrane protein